MSISLVVDTGSDIDLETAEKLGISLVPLTVRFGDTVYLDGYDMKKDDFYDRLVNMGQYPATGAPSPYQFEEIFEKEIEKGNKVICLTLTHQLSGTYQSAKVASEKFGKDVYVIDSLNASMGFRVLVDLALREIKKGNSFEDIIKYIEKMRKYVKVYAYVDTLEYVEKGGRLSKFASIIGGVLKIKPILSLNEEGAIFIPDKTRGLKKGLRKLFENIEKNKDNIKELYLAYSGKSRENLDIFLEDYKEKLKNLKLHIDQLGSTIGTHAGPGAIVASFCVESNE